MVSELAINPHLHSSWVNERYRLFSTANELGFYARQWLDWNRWSLDYLFWHWLAAWDCSQRCGLKPMLVISWRNISEGHSAVTLGHSFLYR